jgi:hypothetical protein
MHVAVDLHAEELRGQEQAHVAVPGRAGVVARLGRERTGVVLVHAHDEADLVLAEADRLARHGEGAARGGAAVVHVRELDAGQAKFRHQRVRLVDLVAAADRELHVGPGKARIGQCRPGRIGAHGQRALAGEPAERVQADSDDRHVRH